MDVKQTFYPETERAVIGAVISNMETAYPMAIEHGISYESFADNDNMILWLNLSEVYADNSRATWQLVQKYSADKGQEMSVSSICFVNASQTLEYDLKKLIDAQQRREIIQMGEDIISEAQTVEDTGEAIATFQERSTAILSGQVSKGYTIPDLVRNSLEAHDRASRGESSGIPSRWGWENQNGNGFQPGTLTIIAARPSIGKTARLLNLFSYFAYNQGLPCGIVSLELSANRIMNRIIADLCSVNLTNLQKGMLSPDNRQKVSDLQNIDAPLHIYDRPCTHESLAAWATAQVKSKGAKIIGIDRVELIQAPKNRTSDTERITANAMFVQQLAKRLEIPIVLLAQLSRQAEAVERPKLSHLQQSGALEQCATVVQLLSRNPDEPGYQTVETAKNQDGVCGSYTQRFNGENQRYENEEY